MDLKTYQNLTQQGVKILQRETVYIDATVKIGRNTVVEPFCVLLGKTVIEENCVIGSFSYLKDATIRSGSPRVVGSVITPVIAEAAATSGETM